VGSTFKPIVYALAIENGYTPCQPVPNQRIYFPNYSNWSPTNSEGGYGDGKTHPMVFGLAHSINTMTAWVMKQIGPRPVIDLARHMGIQSKLPPYPSLCLGTADISLYEMVGAYSTFANKGVYTQPIFITRIIDRNGNVLEEFHPKHQEALSEAGAYSMTRMMQAVVDYGTGAAVRSYGIKGDVCGKTGTTQKNTDGWFIGCAPKLVAGAWVGGDDRVIRFQSTYLGQGATMALPIWAYFFQQVFNDPSLGISTNDIFDRPADIDMNQYNCGGSDNDNIDYGNGTNEDNR
jgi:penicillin-binding protein 1A